MIPYATCMCFGRSQPQPWTKKGRSAVSVEVKRNVYHISLRDGEAEERRTLSRLMPPLTPSECGLLEELEEQPRPMGPFHSPQRKRARIPVVVPELGRLPILDPSYAGSAQFMLENVGDWDFNTFLLDSSTGGRSVPVLLVHLFAQYGLLAHFRLDVAKVWRCFSLIEAGYHSNNPYHNSVHAADVTQAMHCFLQEHKISEFMNPVETMASLIAAVTHDLDHPGVNQPFLIATSNHLAALYKNFSVLENHHWRSAMSCLRESGMLDHLGKNLWKEVEWQVKSLILATDITRQQEFLSRFRRYLDSDMLNMSALEYRHFILQIALKCADLCNPCRPWEVSKRWSYQVCQEFYRQGDIERKLKLPVTPMCDRTISTVPKIQADFFKFVVAPLFEIWDRFLGTPLSSQLLKNLHSNHAIWEQKVKDDLAAKEAAAAATAVSSPKSGSKEATEELSDDDEDEENEREDMKLDEDLNIWARRHSMPLSMPKLLPRTTIRRQSLPQSRKENDELRLFHHLHRSPHISLRTLSASDLMPKPSLLSLSRGSKSSLIKKMEMAAAELERKLVYQPASYPPYPMQAPDPEITSRLVSDEPSSSKDEDISKPMAEEEEYATKEASKDSEEETSNSEKYKCINGCGTPNVTSEEALNNSARQSSSSLKDLAELQQEPNEESDSNLSPLYTDKDTGNAKVQPTTTWCSKVCMTAERSQHYSRDFDSPYSWRSNRNNDRKLERRGSAPGGLRKQAFLEAQENCYNESEKGNENLLRRWSIPTHCIESTNNEATKLRAALVTQSLRCELVRRHSFGIMESLLSSGSENASPPNGVTQSLLSEVPFNSELSPEASSKLMPANNAQHGGARRGSLPGDLPMSSNRGYVGGAMEEKGRKPGDMKPAPGSKRRRSTGEILCALFAPISTIAAFHTVTNLGDIKQCVSFHGLPRRGSGSLELLGSIWRSRTLDFAQDPRCLRVPPPHSLSLDSSSFSKWRISKSQELCSSPLGELLLYPQRRRGSEPLEVSLHPILTATAGTKPPANCPE